MGCISKRAHAAESGLQMVVECTSIEALLSRLTTALAWVNTSWLSLLASILRQIHCHGVVAL